MIPPYESSDTSTKDLFEKPLLRVERDVESVLYSESTGLKGNRYQSQIHYSNGTHYDSDFCGASVDFP